VPLPDVRKIMTNLATTVIFDMDGLMLDTERIARRIWRQALQERGYTLTDDMYTAFVGLSPRDARLLMYETFGSDLPLSACEARVGILYRDIIEQDGVPLKHGLINCLDFLDTTTVTTAVATSTERRYAVPLLKRTNLLHRFHTVVTGDDIGQGKPAPDIFLVTAERLSASPEECIVLEDSLPGIYAARNAGMIPIMIPDLVAPPDDISHITHAVVSTLDVAVPLIARLTGHGAVDTSL